LKAWRSLDRNAISPKIEVIPKNQNVLVILLIVSHHSPDNVFRAYYPRAKNSAAIPCPTWGFPGEIFFAKRIIAYRPLAISLSAGKKFDPSSRVIRILLFRINPS
jgi:hypothetical protein